MSYGKPWTSLLCSSCLRLLRGRRCGACFFCLLALWCCAFMLSDSLLSFHRGGIWRAYFVATPEMWDSIHRHGASTPGGIWHYNQSRLEASYAFRFLSQKKYSSLLDVSCNVGITLASLQRYHGAARHYGTDISKVMVETTQKNCPNCQAAQFDLGRLQFAGSLKEMRTSLPSTWPTSFDVILVSDVLIYISWAHIAPIFLRCECCCSVFRSWALSAQQTFLQNIASLAKDEVIFSLHQNNIVVTTMMRELGVRLDEDRGLWRLPGTARNSNSTL